MASAKVTERARAFSAAMIGMTWWARVGGDAEMPAREGLLAGEQRLRLVLGGEQPRRDALELAAGLGGHARRGRAGRTGCTP